MTRLQTFLGRRVRCRAACVLAVVVGWCPCLAANGQHDPPLVPGSGVKVSLVGDDFEDENWGYVLNGAKASHEQDEQTRPPGGRSRNGRWYESAKRGHPDVVRRIATPPGGPAGSRGALFLATKYSGVPGELSRKQQQDDLLMNVQGRLGGAVPVSWQPSCVVQVYLPEFERWENRSGASFGIRADVRGRDRDGKIEPYWPGMFILFRSSSSTRYDHDFAEIRVRALDSGRDAPGPVIETPGWWTFGLSFTADGRVHQYASPGLDPLTEEDYLLSSFPYGYQCLYFDNFFVNVANLDNGQTWSTPWVIDNAEFYVVPPRGQTVGNLLRRGQMASKRSAKPSPPWFSASRGKTQR